MKEILQTRLNELEQNSESLNKANSEFQEKFHGLFQTVKEIEVLLSQKTCEGEPIKEPPVFDLTGACSVYSFKEQAEEYIKNMKDDEQAAFLLVNMDDFKDVNQKYGNLFGDMILANIAEGIAAIHDVELFAGRFDADEFMILIKDVQDETAILHVVSRISSILKETYHNNTIASAITLSMGIAKIPEDGIEAKEIFGKADFALQQVKQNGKNQYATFFSYKKAYSEEMINKNRFEFIKDDAKELRLHLSEEVVEFMIEILDKVEDFSDAVSIIMTNLGRVFQLSYISLRWADHKEYNFVLEHQWKNSGHYPDLREVHQYNRKDFQDFLEKFDETGVLICKNCTESSVEQYKNLWGAQAGAKSTLQCLIMENKIVTGVLSFAFTQTGRCWKEQEIKILKLASKVLSLHVSCHKKFSDVSRQVKNITNYDKVTGLYTYDKFKEEAITYLADANEDVAIVYNDFTNFKHINDAFGYMTGDTILRDFANFVVTENPKAIMGTREFADNIIILTHATNRFTLQEYCERFGKIFENRQNEKYPGLNLRVSTGAYIINRGDLDIVKAIDNANIARKDVKRQRLGGFAFFENNMLAFMNYQAQILSDFPKAIANKEFKMYLQPQIAIQEEQLIGAEALVRWQKEDGSFVYPDEFIPILEKNGSIVELDYYMLDLALRLLSRWKKNGKKMVPISVNFSRIHFYSATLLKILLNKVIKYDVEPKYIDIEITEGLFIENYNEISEHIKDISKEGFLISIDDFGTGYSSLNVLSNLDVQNIKIDKSFLYGAEKSETQKNVIEYMFSLAKELKLGVVCEGAETEKQIELLKESGCQVVQGYYYDKPMTVEEFCEKYID